MSDDYIHICLWGNQPSVIIWVHGHGQCSECGINVDECCRGKEDHPLINSLKKAEKEKSKDD
jgi:hypothetical protein